MIALEVSVDERPVCLAGIGESGVLLAFVQFNSEMPPGEETSLSVGGVNSRTGEKLDWLVPPLALGSKVSVRVTEASEVDPPDRCFAGSGMSRAEEFRQHLQRLAGEMTDDERRGLIRELVAELED